jgi:DNA-binding MarR family transcriptional regulator
MSNIPPPNYTQVPNYILDNLDRFTNEAEMKVVLVVARKTFGWQKKRDTISLSQLEDATGMTRQSVADGLKRAISNGWIERVVDGNSFSYAVVVQKVDQSKPQTSPESRPKVVQKVDQQVVQNLDTQKKELKKEIKRATPPAVEAFRHSAKAYPAKGQWDPITATVGDEPKALALWERVVAGYVLKGWNPRNVAGMLEFFKRGEVPGGNGSKPAASAPAATGPWRQPGGPK